MKAIRQILAVVVALIIAVFAFVAVHALPIIPFDQSELLMVIYVILCIGVPLFVLYFTARLIMWEPLGVLDRIRRLPRWFLIVVAIAYIFTWAFGVPAVQTTTNSIAINLYKYHKSNGDSRVSDTHPWIRTSVAFPIVPGLIVSYHEYQVAGLHGWGGWELHVWYLTGVKNIGGLTIWIS